MRVVHVIGPMNMGGAQTQLLGLVRAAHGHLWEATVVATSGGSLSEAMRESRIPYVELKRLGSPGLLRIRALRGLVSRGGFDVVHGNLWQSNAYARLAVVGRRRRPGVVISERNVEPRRSWVRRRIDGYLAGVTDVYVGNTDAVVSFIERVHPVQDNVVMVPNAVDRKVFRPSDQPRPRGENRVIGAVGRLDEEKGFDVLIEAVRILTSEGEKVEVRIAGEGARYADLTAQADGLPVKLIGRLPTGEPVADFLRSLDVFCLPARHREGRPNVVLEAIATDLPIVTTAIDGMNEVLTGDTLVPPSDPRRLADALRSALRDSGRWKERSVPADVPGFARLAASYEALFRTAIAKAAVENGESA